MTVCAQRVGGSLADFGLPVQNIKAGICVCSWNELAQTAEMVNVAECPWGSGAPCMTKPVLAAPPDVQESAAACPLTRG